MDRTSVLTAPSRSSPKENGDVSTKTARDNSLRRPTVDVDPVAEADSLAERLANEFRRAIGLRKPPARTDSKLNNG